jgi:hypothetical protein
MIIFTSFFVARSIQFNKTTIFLQLKSSISIPSSFIAEPSGYVETLPLFAPAATLYTHLTYRIDLKMHYHTSK